MTGQVLGRDLNLDEIKLVKVEILIRIARLQPWGCGAARHGTRLKMLLDLSDTQGLVVDRDQVVVDQWYARFGIVPYINLMAAAPLFVIPNSTFGWWASWLSGEKRQETVAPAKWFRDPTRDTSDLVPVEWTRI